MRFESVEAYAFGPFRDASLALAPGMNVVHGANEAGKSTWHAALHAGLCGVRRGKGRAPRFDAEFERRHRPWDGDGAWEVGAVVALADGRRVALRHDLAGRVESSVRDADLAGRDYANEIVFDGAPDGSCWLGLNRVSFLHTACVRQAQILALKDGADALQGALQAAADSAGTDATAARALELLSDYRRERVGSERARTKPLLQWRSEVGTASTALRTARDARDAYLHERLRIAELEAALQDVQTRLGAARARELQERAERLKARLVETRTLAQRFPDGPPRPFDDHVLADRVTAAITTWAARPAPGDRGPTSAADLAHRQAELERELESASVRSRQGPRVVLAGAGACLVAAVATLLADFTLPAAVLAGVGVALLWLRRRAQRSRQEDTAAILVERDRVVVELAHQHRTEAAVAEAERGLAAAERTLAAAATAANVAADTPAARHEGLMAWQRKRRERLDRSRREQDDWDALQRLLSGRTLEELAARADALDASVREAWDAVPGATAGAPDASGSIGDLEACERVASDTLQSARGALGERAVQLPDLAAAEERLSGAERRLRNVERLDATLGRTIDLLAAAEQRVHRDVAQILRETVLDWLPQVTGGRYSACRVDPASLAVEVRGPDGRFRNAELLSHGTAEQVYLLLRLALARHLTRAGEACPLLLDDALSGCDATRARAVLETLLAVAGETQVILFTHDDAVRAWAKASLGEPRDRLITLEAPAKL